MYLRNYLLTGERRIIGAAREAEARRKDGTIFPIELSVSEMKINGMVFFAGVIRDISERKLLEDALLAANKLLSEANDRLEEAAITDSLTGLYNRRHLDERMREELRRAARHQTPLALVMGDVDYFKNFNDCYGHQAGDRCLQIVAECIRHTFQRSGEIAARYGGEEFVVIVPGADYDQARERAESLRFSVQNARIPHSASSSADVVTISVGVAVFIPAGNETRPPSPEEFMSRADKMLYRAKQQGRNRIEVDAHGLPPEH